MSVGEYGLNGWTAARLDDLASDVSDIKRDIAQMRSDEMRQLRQDLRDARERPRLHLTGFVLPVIAAAIPSMVVLVTHYA